MSPGWNASRVTPDAVHSSPPLPRRAALAPAVHPPETLHWPNQCVGEDFIAFMQVNGASSASGCAIFDIELVSPPPAPDYGALVITLQGDCNYVVRYKRRRKPAAKPW